jgi:cobalt-zinc-cadmium efflux system membrane fusion protein
MHAKQTVMAIVTAFIGLVAGAAAMWYVYGPARAAHEAPMYEERPGGNGQRAREDHDHHEGHTEEGESQTVRLTEAHMRELGIAVETAGPGTLMTHLTLPGHVALNADHRAQIVPRIAGVVQQVLKNLGDPVRAGEVIAVIESRELADVKSAYLTAKERLSLADTAFRREEDLWKKKISPEQEYLEARRALAEARIELRTAEQKLQAIGLSQADLSQLPARADITFTRYSLTAPFEGTVIEKHVTLGEVVKDDAPAFVIADLRSVWVNLSIYPKDLSSVRKGQRVHMNAGDGIPEAHGSIAYVGPVVHEETRTALARVVLPNPEGYWRPGLFVTATIDAGTVEIPLLVPKSALQTVNGRASVFTLTLEGFALRPVTTGRSNNTHVEITAGLQAGERYAATQTFILKAELGKGEGEHGH